MRALNTLQQLGWLASKLIIAAILCLLLLLVAGGLLLNNASFFNLHEVRISSQRLAKWYPNEQLDIDASSTGDHWYYQYEDFIYQNSLPWQQCDGDFVAAHKQQDYLIIACSQELLLFDKFDRISDRINENYGLPDTIDALGYVGQQIFIRNQDRVFNIDLSSMELFEAMGAGSVQWVEQQALPEKYLISLQEERKIDVATALGDLYRFLFLTVKGKSLVDILLIFAGILIVAVIWLLLFYKEVDELDDEHYIDDDLGRDLDRNFERDLGDELGEKLGERLL